MIVDADDIFRQQELMNGIVYWQDAEDAILFLVIVRQYGTNGQEDG